MTSPNNILLPQGVLNSFRKSSVLKSAGNSLSTNKLDATRYTAAAITRDKVGSVEAVLTSIPGGIKTGTAVASQANSGLQSMRDLVVKIQQTCSQAQSNASNKNLISQLQGLVVGYTKSAIEIAQNCKYAGGKSLLVGGYTQNIRVSASTDIADAYKIQYADTKSEVEKLSLVGNTGAVVDSKSWIMSNTRYITVKADYDAYNNNKNAFWEPAATTWQDPTTVKNDLNNYTFLDNHANFLRLQNDVLEHLLVDDGTYNVAANNWKTAKINFDAVNRTIPANISPANRDFLNATNDFMISQHDILMSNFPADTAYATAKINYDAAKTTWDASIKNNAAISNFLDATILFTRAKNDFIDRNIKEPVAAGEVLENNIALTANEAQELLNTLLDMATGAVNDIASLDSRGDSLAETISITQEAMSQYDVDYEATAGELNEAMISTQISSYLNQKGLEIAKLALMAVQS